MCLIGLCFFLWWNKKKAEKNAALERDRELARQAEYSDAVDQSMTYSHSYGPTYGAASSTERETPPPSYYDSVLHDDNNYNDKERY